MGVWREFNPNPVSNNTGDCAVRAVAAALNISWDDAYDMIAERAKQMGEIMQSNAAWGSVLRQHGFYRTVIPMTCPDCYTARDFCMENPHGIFVLGFGNHVACVIDGQLWDSWDSSDLIPQYLWYLPE